MKLLTAGGHGLALGVHPDAAAVGAPDRAVEIGVVRGQYQVARHPSQVQGRPDPEGEAEQVGDAEQSAQVFHDLQQHGSALVVGYVNMIKERVSYTCRCRLRQS